MSSSANILEICAYSLASCKLAQAGGANRIELCSGRPEGGTTPSLGLISQVLESVDIPVYVMIRPRGGDFLYSTSELQVMLADIAIIKNLNPSGFVFGVLDKEGNVDIAKMQLLMDACAGFPVTFHRAFDRCRNPQASIETLINLGVENILTSGQYLKAPAGLENLRQYVIWAQSKINIMAGSGLNPSNIMDFANIGIRHFHFSATISTDSAMLYRNTNMHSNDEFVLYEVDIDMVQAATNFVISKSQM